LIKRKKTTGGIRKKADFVRKKTPIKTNSKPKYIGLRVTRNGPFVTNCVGSSPGRTDVPAFRKVAKPEAPTSSPAATNKAPMTPENGIARGLEGINAVRQALKTRSSRTRTGGGISGELARTVERNYKEF
jgi:hypothetical protein